MKIKSILSIAIVMLLIVVNASAVPNAPEQLYGNVLIDGSPAKDGTTISAVINTIEYARTSTVGGKYGYETPLFYVPGDQKTSISDGTLIKLYVNGVYATELSFKSMSNTKLDLSITTGNPVVTFNKPGSSGASSVGQVDNPKSPPPAPQTNATVQSTPVVQQKVPVQTTSAPENAPDITPSGTPRASAIDSGLSIITLLFAGIILRTIRKK
jgi:hypothetical protein